MADGSDTDPTGRPQEPHDEAYLRLRRAQAKIAHLELAALNQTTPAPHLDPNTGRYVFMTAPVPLKRLLSSPLALGGKFGQGVGGTRLISSHGSWGWPRAVNYSGVKTGRTHQGLDFLADYGEPITACAKGRVTFVGYQRRQQSRVQTTNPNIIQRPGSSNSGSKLDADLMLGEQVIAFARTQLGFAGLYVQITHSEDFEGYITEYMHLSQALVVPGQKVDEGQLIAKVGGTGGSAVGTIRGSGIHLHFQVRFAGGNTVVNPTGLVPNYYPNGTDSSNSELGGVPAAFANIPFIGHLAIAKGYGQLSSLDRGVSMASQTRAERYAGFAGFFARVKDSITAETGALSQGVAGAQAVAPVIATPMTFNFETGTWSDGKPV